MKRIAIIFAVLLAGCCGIYLFNSCVKKDFDAPPDVSGYDPGLPVTHTISELLAMPYGTAISDDVVIQGIVVMDDHSGNYYKSIVIEDSTGGIQVLLDQNSLYNDYPVGMKLYVKCKGLYLDGNKGTPQLGYIPDNTGAATNIPFNLISDHLVKANYPNPIVPDTFTITQLKDAGGQYVNTLVAIKDVEFDSAVLGSTYAEPASVNSATNLQIDECLGSSIILRTSGYANFQPVLVPGGSGVIVGIYTQYTYLNGDIDPQLYIRDTNDVMFTGQRCDGGNAAAQYILNDGLESLVNWNAVSVIGDQVWQAKTFGSIKCAVMTGHVGGSSGEDFENEDWLISKSLNFSEFNTITLSFETAARYGGNILECYISTDYNEGEPGTATWIPMENATLANVNSSSFDFVPSGNIDLSSYAGSNNVRIAFKYTSTTSAAATWEVDNVKVIGAQ